MNPLVSTLGGTYVDFPEVDFPDTNGYTIFANSFNICIMFFGYPLVETSQFITFSRYIVYTSSLNGTVMYLIVFLSNNYASL